MSRATVRTCQYVWPTAIFAVLWDHWLPSIVAAMT